MTSMYRTKLRLVLPIEFEAASSGEAHRIVDGIVNAVRTGNGEVVLFEGSMDDPIDQLSGKVERIERDDIERVD